MKKRLARIGFDPVTHKPKTAILASADGDPKNNSNLSHIAQWESARLQAEARFVRQSKLLKPAPPAPPQCLDFNLRAWETLLMSKSLLTAGGGGGGDDGGVGRATNIEQEVGSLGIFGDVHGNNGEQFKAPTLTMSAALDFNEALGECGDNECGELLEALLLQHSYNNSGFDVGNARTLEQYNNINENDQDVIMNEGLTNTYMLWS